MRSTQNLDCGPSSPEETGKRTRRAGSYGGVSGETGITVQSVNWLNSPAKKEGASCNEKLIFDDAPRPNSPTFSGPTADTSDDHRFSTVLSSRSVQCESIVIKEPTCSPSRSTIDVSIQAFARSCRQPLVDLSAECPNGFMIDMTALDL